MIIDIDLSPVSVLIIDHSLYARSVLKSILASFGVRSIIESDGVESAFAALAQHKIGFVMVERDLMPQSGIDFVRRLRRDMPAGMRDVPVVMLSSTAEKEKVAEARAAGVHEYLIRPVSAESLFRRLRSLLINPRPFVDSADYVGPCRRFVDPMDGADGERRQNPPLPRPQPLLHMPPGGASSLVRQAIQESVDQNAGDHIRSYRLTVKAGEWVFRAGTIGDCAYVLESGEISLYGSQCDQGNPIGMVTPQGVFGEMALIDDLPRQVSAMASRDSVCLAIPRTVLKREMAQTPDLVILVVETLLHDIRKMGHELAQLRE